MEYINMPLEIARKLYCLFYVHAAGCYLITGAAVFYNEILTAVLSDGVADFNCKTCPIFGAAAVFIGAVVKERACELGYQVAVAAVDHYYVHSGSLHSGSRFAELLYRFFDFLL